MFVQLSNIIVFVLYMFVTVLHNQFSFKKVTVLLKMSNLGLCTIKCGELSAHEFYIHINIYSGRANIATEKTKMLTP